MSWSDRRRAGLQAELRNNTCPTPLDIPHAALRNHYACSCCATPEMAAWGQKAEFWFLGFDFRCGR